MQLFLYEPSQAQVYSQGLNFTVLYVDFSLSLQFLRAF